MRLQNKAIHFMRKYMAWAKFLLILSSYQFNEIIVLLPDSGVIKENHNKPHKNAHLWWIRLYVAY